MRSSLIPVGGLVLIAAVLGLGAGCDRTRASDAAVGGQPVTGQPVGPIPGIATAGPGIQNPYGGEPGALQDGRRLFVQMNCSGCHGGHAGGGMGPSLRDVDWIYGSSDGEVFDSIARGRAHGMPAWGALLPADQIWKLTAYVRSLRTPSEPEKPQ